MNQISSNCFKWDDISLYTKKLLTAIITQLNSSQINMDSVADIRKDDALDYSIDITFRNLVYEVEVLQKSEGSTNQIQKEGCKKRILNGISGIFKAGELNVIMGASGAGKTTLLNILAGRISDFQGELLANNTTYSFQTFGDFANYVMQGDLLMQALTVRQTLEFAANLKVKNKEEAQRRISDLTKKLKLQKCLDVVVGGPIIKGISGGERKRTSIAFELISDPQVVALDEPTSGMDSLTSFIIVNQLKELTRAGKTIFLTIHQPNSEIFELFDRLLLMVDGRIIYQGPSEGAESYFASNFGLQCPELQNPADYFMSIIHHESVQNRNRYPAYISTYDKIIAPAIEQRISGRSEQQLRIRKTDSSFSNTLSVLLKRDYLNTIRNPLVMQSRIFQIIFMAIFTGGLYFGAGRQDYVDPIKWAAMTGFLTFVSMDMFMQSLLPVTIIFPMQKLVFLKEQNSKMYGVLPYFISRNIIDIPYLIVIPLFFQLIIYWMVGMGNTPEQFFFMYLIMFLHFFTATSLGLLIGSMITDAKTVSAILNMVFQPFIVFSGLYKNNHSYADWIGWLRFLSPFNYCFTALIENEAMYKQSRINHLNLDVSMWIAALILFSFGVGFRIISCFMLWFKKGKLQ